jgi:hypothetical protein
MSHLYSSREPQLGWRLTGIGDRSEKGEDGSDGEVRQPDVARRSRWA